jgi:hypothetical protein
MTSLFAIITFLLVLLTIAVYVIEQFNNTAGNFLSFLSTRLGPGVFLKPTKSYTLTWLFVILTALSAGVTVWRAFR